MANYPGIESERRFDPETLQASVAGVFRACGMGEADADLLAEMLVEADVRGIHSHGVMRVPNYVKRLTTGGVDPRGRPSLVKDNGGALVVDGGNNMGQIGGTFAMAAAIDRAREVGIAFAAVGNSNHCGAMEYYARMTVAADMICVCGTNALPAMAPWGGIDRLVGLNPIGIGIPAGEELPIIMDFALGATAHGKMEVYQQKGQPIPEGWAFDRRGRPTTDIDEALVGLVQPIGQYKGIGLAMAVGILSTLLSGTGYGSESGNVDTGPIAGRDGQFYLALNVAAFEEVPHFKARIDKIIREYKGTRLADGFDRVYVPGALEYEIEARYRENGIPLNDATLGNIVEAAAKVDADVSALR